MPKKQWCKKNSISCCDFFIFWGKNQVLFGIDVQIKIIISHH